MMNISEKEALLYLKKERGKVQCALCAHRCVIEDGRFGICGVRQNKGGRLYSLSYGNLISANVDPIEKKPIFHLLPGHSSYSIATVGCNFRCDFCQNWEISQKKEAERFRVRSFYMSPEQIVKESNISACDSIAYTYTEPTVFFEYAYDIGRLAHKKGIFNVFVTNGFMTKECLDKLKGILDAANVDLKSFNDEYYKRICGGRLKPVLDSIEYMKRSNIWVEVTTLVVPTLNDSEDELQKIAKFIASISRDIPWHISRFYPQYKVDTLSPTPIEKLNMAYELGKSAGLKYVYLGNVPGQGEDTVCPNCGEVVIKRIGYFVKKNRVGKDGKCKECGGVIDGIFTKFS